MRNFVFIAALLLAASPLGAQTIDNTATSGSESNSQTYGAVTNNIQTTSPDKLRTTSHASIGGFAGSFSPDYCSGTNGGSIGATGWGLSLGGPKADANCQRMRRVERFGQLAAQANNLGQREQAQALMQMAVFEVCTATPSTTDACRTLGLVVPKE